MAAGGVVFVLALTACVGDNSGISTTPGSAPASTVSGPSAAAGLGDECADAVTETIAGFGDIFDQIEADPAQAEDVLSSVEMDNLFISLGQPLENVCGPEVVNEAYSEVLVYLSAEVSRRANGAGQYVDELVTALCEADIFELTAEATSACSTS